MRVGILRTQVPFVTGGAERHAANLCAQLQAYGHEATEISVPFKWYPGEVLADHILAARMLDLTEVEGVPTDLLIGLKFPAYLAPHPNKLFWVLHQHRQAYDQWDLGQSDLLTDPDGIALKHLIQEEDRAAFAASPHPIYANSGNVAARLKKHLDVDANPLYHPPPNAERLSPGRYGDYLFAPGRINPSKRLDLMIRALPHAGRGTRLVVAGIAENPAYQDELIALARKLSVDDRITWLGAVDDDTLLRHYAEARAVVFTPQDEDYGYITLEAMLAAKAVITVTDAGGPLEFVRDGKEGLITAPDPTALGRAFQQLSEDAALAETMGDAGKSRYDAMDISWAHVIEAFTGQTSIAAQAPVPLDQPAPALDESGGQPPEADPTPDATERLAQAIAPSQAPEGLRFSSVQDVFDTYMLDALAEATGQDTPADQGMVAYISSHWTRYMTTLSALDGIDISDALDVGVFPPLVFQTLLADFKPGIKQAGLWEGPDPYAQTIKSRKADFPDIPIRLEAANGERDLWPYEDGSFDLVTALEIMEHLALDPAFFFAQAARVLRPGGHLLITTPNVVSHRGVWKTLNGVAPYSFGIFVPSGGVYGRHNREYAPQELVEFGAAAGLELVSLRTADVYDQHIDPATAELLDARDDNLSLRGENIIYLARKPENAAAPGVPDLFYHGAPQRMAGQLTPGAIEADTGLVNLEITNRSDDGWPLAGKGGTCLLAEWIDPDGALRFQHLFQPLPSPLRPDESVTVALRLEPAAKSETGTLRLHLYQIDVGVMSGSGRAAPCALPCSKEAFLALVKHFPSPSGGAA